MIMILIIYATPMALCVSKIALLIVCLFVFLTEGSGDM